MTDGKPSRPLHWMGSTKKDVLAFPEDVKRVMGFCLNKLQEGEFDKRIERMSGDKLKKANAVEIRDNFEGDTFRTMAAIKFSEAIYVLHVFKKNPTRARKHHSVTSIRS